jgi:hypothetical protein
MRIGAAISEMKNLSPRPQPLLKITGDMTLTFALQFQAFCRCDPAGPGQADFRPRLATAALSATTRPDTGGPFANARKRDDVAPIFCDALQEEAK